MYLDQVSSLIDEDLFAINPYYIGQFKHKILLLHLDHTITDKDTEKEASEVTEPQQETHQDPIPKKKFTVKKSKKVKATKNKAEPTKLSMTLRSRKKSKT